MSNEFFDSGDYTPLVKNTTARAGDVNALMAAIVAGFDALDWRSYFTGLVFHYDHFLYTQGTTNFAPYWTVHKGSDSNTDASIPLGTNDSGGLLVLTTGSNAAGSMATNGVQVTGARAWRANDPTVPLTIEWRVLFGGITDRCVFFGFTDENTALEMPFTMAAGDVLTSNATNAIGFLFDTAADTDNMWLVGVTADVDCTKQDVGSAPSTAAAERWRLEITQGGVATFYRDNVQVGVAMTGAPASGARLCPVVAMFSRTNATKQIQVNHVFIGRAAG